MREIILGNGWRQGSIFRASDVPQDTQWAGGAKQRHLCIVLPYSCAVVADNTNEEPYVEVIRLAQERDPRPHWRHMQHARNLVIPIVNVPAQAYEFWRARMADRYFLPKGVLAEFSPSVEYLIEDEVLDQLITWVTKRYTRVAFPEEFNEICSDPMSAIHHHVQALTQDPVKVCAIVELEGIYIRIVKLADAPFEIDFLLITKDRSPSEDHLQVYEEIKEFILGVFEDLDGTEIDRLDILSMYDISMGEMAQYQRLEYDDISYSTADQTSQ